MHSSAISGHCQEKVEINYFNTNLKSRNKNNSYNLYKSLILSVSLLSKTKSIFPESLTSTDFWVFDQHSTEPHLF